MPWTDRLQSGQKGGGDAVPSPWYYSLHPADRFSCNRRLLCTIWAGGGYLECCHAYDTWSTDVWLLHMYSHAWRCLVPQTAGRVVCRSGDGACLEYTRHSAANHCSSLVSEQQMSQHSFRCPGSSATAVCCLSSLFPVFPCIFGSNALVSTSAPSMHPSSAQRHLIYAPTRSKSATRPPKL